MSTSPYLSADIKAYMKKYQIESLINKTVNDLLRALPEDPYSYIIGDMQKLASSAIQIINCEFIEVISGEGFPVLKMKPTVKYLNKDRQFIIDQPLSILSDENMLYDEDRLSGKGLNKTIIFAKKLLQKIRNLKCQQQQEIDRQLEKGYQQNNNFGIYAVNMLSQLAVLAQSYILCQPLYRVYGQIAGNQGRELKCMVNCLHGGKAIGSKCKVFKFYAVAKQVSDPTLLQTVLQAVRKGITSGKGGEAALKLSPDGTFICPLDTIADNLKLLQDSITASGAKDHISIGLSFQADTLFSADTKKYELQNPKTPFDNDQMIDYLIKLLVDKPIIQYLQDPLAGSEKVAWKKLINKVRETQAIKGVKIGSRNGKLINLGENVKAQVSELSVDQTVDSHPDSNQQSRKAANSLKFKLDFVQVRGYQLKTVSTLIRAYNELNKVKTQLIVQDCSLQTYDTSLIDLCYGLGCYSNLGSIAKFDRIAKLNRMRQIIAQSKQQK